MVCACARRVRFYVIRLFVMFDLYVYAYAQYAVDMIVSSVIYLLRPIDETTIGQLSV